jgi:hypothetical protein
MERSELVAEWIRLVEEADDKPVQVAQVSKGGRGKKSGISQASRELGIDRYTARRAVKVANLTPEAKATARSWRTRESATHAPDPCLPQGVAPMSAAARVSTRSVQ